MKACLFPLTLLAALLAFAIWDREHPDRRHRPVAGAAGPGRCPGPVGGLGRGRGRAGGELCGLDHQPDLSPHRSPSTTPWTTRRPCTAAPWPLPPAKSRTSSGRRSPVSGTSSGSWRSWSGWTSGTSCSARRSAAGPVYHTRRMSASRRRRTAAYPGYGARSGVIPQSVIRSSLAGRRSCGSSPSHRTAPHGRPCPGPHPAPSPGRTARAAPADRQGSPCPRHPPAASSGCGRCAPWPP